MGPLGFDAYLSVPYVEVVVLLRDMLTCKYIHLGWPLGF